MSNSFVKQLMLNSLSQSGVHFRVLIDLSSLALSFEQRLINRITATLFWELKPHYPLSDADIQKFVTENEDEDSEAINFDMNALKQDLEKHLAEFTGTGRIRELNDPLVGDVWLVENELNGWTLMKPSDY